MGAIQLRHCVKMSRLQVTVSLIEGKRWPWIVLICISAVCSRMHERVLPTCQQEHKSTADTGSRINESLVYLSAATATSQQQDTNENTI